MTLKFSIRSKLAAFSVGIVLTLLSLHYLLESHLLNAHRQSDLQDLIDKTSTFSILTSKQARENLQMALLIAENSSVRKALASRDKKTLLKIVKPVMQEMKRTGAENVRIHFHIPPCISFLRVWLADRNGDDLSGFRRSVKEVLETGTTFSGIEIGRAGPVVRGIVPVLDMSGKITGSVEVFTDLGPLIETLSDFTGLSYTLYTIRTVRQDLAENATQTVGKYLMLQLSASDSKPHALSQKELDQAMQGQGIFRHKDQVVITLPIKDIFNHTAGVLAGIISIRALDTHLEEFVRSSRVVAGFITIFIIGLSFLWGNSLVKSLKGMVTTITKIKRHIGDAEGMTGGMVCVTSCTMDEVGDVGRAINELITSIKEISIFRRTIEADEDPEEIYLRLANVFERKLKLPAFVIYEVDTEKNSMKPIYCQPPELKEELHDFLMTEKCRAKRTGMPVSSMEDPCVCLAFKWEDAFSYECLPMTVAGQVIGVVEFIFPYADTFERKEKIAESLREAKKYLNEMLPVLQAKRLAKQLKEQAVRDQLTKLYNRRYLETSLEGIVAGIKRRNTCMGILLCDMDYFKEVNDRHGHDSGDALLIELAMLFTSLVRTSDIIVRFGGEEFLILLMDCQEADAISVAEKIRIEVENHLFRLPGVALHRTISIGVSEFPEDTDAIWEAIKFADMALYRAKELGRNRVVRFKPEMWEEENMPLLSPHFNPAVPKA